MVDLQSSPRSGARPGNFRARWKARFEEFARSGEDDAAIAGWSPGGLGARLRNFARLWNVEGTTGIWLDAGCGAGTYSRWLRDRGTCVVAMDYSLPTIIKARSRTAERLPWVVGDVTCLPFGPGMFDGALCFGVTQALESSDVAVAELTSVVKPGGEVWVDALNGWCLPHLWERFARWLRRRPPHVRYECPRRLGEAMARQGLRELRRHWVPILPRRLQGLQPWAEAGLVLWVLHTLPALGALTCHAFVIRGVRVSSETASRPARQTHA